MKQILFIAIVAIVLLLLLRRRNPAATVQVQPKTTGTATLSNGTVVTIQSTPTPPQIIGPNVGGFSITP